MNKETLNPLIQATVKHSPCMVQVDEPVGTWEALIFEQPCSAEGWEDTSLTLSCESITLSLNDSYKMNGIKEIK